MTVIKHMGEKPLKLGEGKEALTLGARSITALSPNMEKAWEAAKKGKDVAELLKSGVLAEVKPKGVAPAAPKAGAAKPAAEVEAKPGPAKAA